MNLYLYAVREQSDEKQRKEIDEALQPPLTMRNADGAPAWYGDDDDAWSQWEQQARRS